MAVTHTFAPNTIIKSAQVNTNNTGITDGSAMNDIANSIIFRNTKGINIKDLGGIERKVLSLEANNNVTLWVNVDGRVVVIDRMPRRNHNANTYVDSHIQRGWGYIQGDNSPNINAAVTFAKAYSVNLVTVVISPIGVKFTASGVPTSEDDTQIGTTALSSAECYDISNTGFTAQLDGIDGNNMSNTTYYMYCWIAIGVV